MVLMPAIKPVQNAEGRSSCEHSDLYRIGQETAFCGLCFLRDGYESEVPGKLHEHKQLAENGNPETSPKFLAHLETVLGLVPPKKGENLHDFRLARAHLSRRLAGLSFQFPVTAALSEMMGKQPPLAVAVLMQLRGIPEREIAQELSVSRYSVQERTAKGIRLALRLMRDASRRQAWRSHPGRSG